MFFTWEPVSAFAFFDFLRSGLPGVAFLCCGFVTRALSPASLPFDFFGFGLLVFFLSAGLPSGQSLCLQNASATRYLISLLSSRESLEIRDPGAW